MSQIGTSIMILQYYYDSGSNLRASTSLTTVVSMALTHTVHREQGRNSANNGCSFKVVNVTPLWSSILALRCACMYVCMYVYIHIYIYIHIHIQTRAYWYTHLKTLVSLSYLYCLHLYIVTLLIFGLRPITNPQAHGRG